MRADITLPIIDQLTVRQYPLYPGKDGQGLDLDFSDGVTVLAGINGIGKTTLLNLLLRMLLGPCDPSKVGQDLGRVSKRQLVVRKGYAFFRDRVPDALGDDATATLVFRLGGKTITVTRHLRDMTLKTAVIGRVRKRFTSEVAFIDELATLANVASAYDFHVLVRYLQFFSEDRMPILWSPGTQFEFFKMLVFDEDLADRLNRTYAEIQRIDTNYRNRLNQNKKREERLPKPESSAGIELESLLGMINAAQAAFDEVDQRYDLGYAAYKAVQEEAYRLDFKLAAAETTLTLAEQEFNKADALYIQQALPSLDDKLQFLMQGLGATGSCFVCGARAKKEVRVISEKLRHGQCFVCRGPVKKLDASNVVPLTAHKVRALELELSNALLALQGVENRREHNDQLERSAADTLRALATERSAAQQALGLLQAQRPIDSPAGDGLRQEVEREKAALATLSLERDALVDGFRSLVDQGQGAMDALKENVRHAFSGYAQAFLQEVVTITFKRATPFQLATGARKVNIPTFSVAMTSSTHAQPEERLSSDNVSESQKEFLDLAFRMALLDLIKPKGGLTMVIETPEASLDTWFMRRAATLMRRFADESHPDSRKLIATSNLNGTQMIPALLGLIDDNGAIHKLDAAHANQLVDLMGLTAPATVLKDGHARAILDAEMEQYAHG
jgi:hypothetical protein